MPGLLTKPTVILLLLFSYALNSISGSECTVADPCCFSKLPVTVGYRGEFFMSRVTSAEWLRTCFDSLPFDDRADRVRQLNTDALQRSFELFYAYKYLGQNTLSNDANPNTYKTFNVSFGFDAEMEKLKTKAYANAVDFHFDLQKIVDQFRDMHTRYNPPFNGLFKLFNTAIVISEWDNVGEFGKQQVLRLKPLTSEGTEGNVNVDVLYQQVYGTDFPLKENHYGKRIVKVNGIDALTFYKDIAWKTSKFRDLGVGFNSYLSKYMNPLTHEVPSDSPDASLPLIYTYEFEDGQTVTVQSVLVIVKNSLFSGDNATLLQSIYGNNWEIPFEQKIFDEMKIWIKKLPNSENNNHNSLYDVGTENYDFVLDKKLSFEQNEQPVKEIENEEKKDDLYLSKMLLLSVSYLWETCLSIFSANLSQRSATPSSLSLSSLAPLSFSMPSSSSQGDVGEHDCLRYQKLGYKKSLIPLCYNHTGDAIIITLKTFAITDTDIRQVFGEAAKISYENNVDKLILDVSENGGGFVQTTQTLLRWLVKGWNEKDNIAPCARADFRMTKYWKDYYDYYFKEVMSEEKLKEKLSEEETKGIEILRDICSFVDRGVRARVYQRMCDWLDFVTPANARQELYRFLQDDYEKPLFFPHKIKELKDRSVPHFRGGVTEAFSEIHSLECLESVSRQELYTLPSSSKEDKKAFYWKDIRVITSGMCGSTCSHFVSTLWAENKATIFSYGGVQRSQATHKNDETNYSDNSSNNEDLEKINFSSFHGGNVVTGNNFWNSVLFSSVAGAMITKKYDVLQNLHSLALVSDGNYFFTFHESYVFGKGLGEASLPREFYHLEADVHLPFWVSCFDVTKTIEKVWNETRLFNLNEAKPGLS